MSTPKTIFISEPKRFNGMPAVWKDWPDNLKKARANLIFKEEMVFLHLWFKEFDKLVVFLKNNINQIDNSFEEFIKNNSVPLVTPIPVRIWEDVLRHMDIDLFFGSIPNMKEKHHYDKLYQYVQNVKKFIDFINKHPNVKIILKEIWGRVLDTVADPLLALKRYLDGLFSFALYSNSKENIIIEKKNLEERYNKKRNIKIKRRLIELNTEIKGLQEKIEYIINGANETYKSNRKYESELRFVMWLSGKLNLDNDGAIRFMEKINEGDKKTIEIRDVYKKEFDVMQMHATLHIQTKRNQRIWDLILQDPTLSSQVKSNRISKLLEDNKKEVDAEEMARQLLEEEQTEMATKSKTKKKKKKKKKKKNKTKKVADAPISSPITVPPPSLKKEEPLMTPHDKVTLINPTLIENKELLFRQDITDDEIRNKSDFLKLCIWDIIMTELKSNTMIRKNKLIFTGGFSTYIHTKGKYETDDIDCKIYPNNIPDDINKYNQTLANYLKKFLTAKSQVFNLKLKQKFGQNIDFNFLASIIDIESGKFVDKVSGDDSKFVVKIAVSMPNPDDSASDGGMWYPTIKKAYCDIGFWNDQLDGAITDDVGLPRLNVEQEWIPDVDIYGEISLLPVEYMILEKEILLDDTEYKYNTQWMIEHKKPRWEEQLRMLKSVRRKKGGKRTRRMRKKMRRKKKYRRTRKK